MAADNATGRKREIELILKYLKRERNVDFSGYRPSMVERRLASRRVACGAADFTGYLLALEKSPEEMDALLDALTINVSGFFRDPLVFDVLEKQVIPILLQEKNVSGDRYLRVWSAGCASGEEPYSLAVLLRETPILSSTDMVVRIFGTDIDTEALRKAARGYYTDESIKNVRFGFFQKYFLPSGEGYLLSPDIQRMVSLSYHDLMSDRGESPSESVYGDFDLVLCRNFLIYLDMESQAEVLAKLDRAIRPGGFLVLGEAESLEPAAMKRNYRQWGHFCKIYRKSIE